MFFISIGACIPLISKSTNPKELIATVVYSIGIFMMFGFSALYHRVNWRPKVLKIMRRLDHSSIFIMIATIKKTGDKISIPIVENIKSNALLTVMLEPCVRLQ